MVPLAGIRVLDLGRIYQGPWCGTLLALAGADVIKVEEPGGEPARSRDPSGATVPLAMLNSNKRAITLYYDTVDALRRAGVPAGPSPVPFPGDTEFVPPPPGDRGE